MNERLVINERQANGNGIQTRSVTSEAISTDRSTSINQ